MTKREYKTIMLAVQAAADIIQNTACPDYPYGGFADKDVEEMFSQLIGWWLKLNEKKDEVE